MTFGTDGDRCMRRPPVGRATTGGLIHWGIHTTRHEGQIRVMVAPNTPTPQPLSPYVPDELSADLPTAALQYADCLKAVVVPIDPNGKDAGSILGKGWPEKASGDPSQLERWWSDNPSAGIGIVAGRSNLVVFDLDVDSIPAELDWLRSGLVQSSRFGESERGHYVFRSAQVFTSGKIKVDGTKVGDILSGNRIFVASPTPHSKQGGEYRWAKTGEVPELPPIALTYLTTKAGGSALPQSDRTINDRFAAKYVGGEQSNAIDWLVDREFKEPASLHDACRDALCWAARESKGGRYSWSEAVAKIKTRAGVAYRARGDLLPATEFIQLQMYAIDQVANISETALRERWQSRWQKSQQSKQTSTGRTDVSTPKAKRKVSDMPIEESLSKGQVRMAAGLCNTYHDKLIYVPEIGWYWWDKKRWQEDSLGKITQFVLATIAKAMKIAGKRMQSGDHEDTVYGDKLWQDAESCQSAAGIEGITRIARTWKGFATPVTSLDADPYTVNLQNLTLNLETGETRNHDSADLITKIANAQYDSSSQCPQWLEYLTKVLPDSEVREFVQVLMGLALAGTQLEHILVIFKGNGRNGKGVFEDVMRHVLGDYAVAAASDLFTASPNAHTTSQTDLMGSRLAVIDETESDARLSEALLKKMTGGGTHTARRMRQNNIRFDMTWLPLMITNYLPRVTSQGADIWDRLVIVDFPTYFKPGEQDKFLREKLKTETDGIFMWAYEGWRKYQQDGYRMTLPESVVAAGLEYRHSQDKLQMWIDQRCQIGHGDLFKTKPTVLLDDYNTWVRSQDSAELLPKKQFLDLLRRKNFSYQTNRAVLVGVRLDPSRVDLSRENGGPVGVGHSGLVTSETRSEQGIGGKGEIKSVTP
ncbi:phage/plasmid primase, P4 family [Mycolicibacterium neoaurum]|nr:phage/plasmid primase, P4 family [Mycolicibacterium neoaurum]